MTRPWDFQFHLNHVPNPEDEGKVVAVALYKCPNCQWQSGWMLGSGAERSAEKHNEEGCDCRLVPHQNEDHLEASQDA